MSIAAVLSELTSTPQAESNCTTHLAGLGVHDIDAAVSRARSQRRPVRRERDRAARLHVRRLGALPDRCARRGVNAVHLQSSSPVAQAADECRWG